MTNRHGAVVTAGPSLELEAFTRLPYGLLVVDRQGRVLCGNRAAAGLIEAAGLPEDCTCCALLGCGSPGGSLSSCLTELALGQNRPLPEIRVELRTATGVRALWVAAAPLGEDAARAVLQLRPAVLGDRRRHGDPQWEPSGQLRIDTLGATALSTPDGSIGGEWLHQRPGQLLCYLVVRRGRPVSIEQIGESIWPGCDYAIAGSVRYYVHALRRRLEPQLGRRAPSRFICSHAGSYCLSLENVEIDADEFERLIRAGLAELATDSARAAERLEQGLELYRGDFLTELPYAEWAIAERDRLHDLACTALRALTEVRREQDRIDCAAGCLARLAAMQPYDEDVHRELMQLDIGRGRRSDAVRRYAALRIRMNRAFGQDPTFTPTELTNSST